MEIFYSKISFISPASMKRDERFSKVALNDHKSLYNTGKCNQPMGFRLIG